MNDALLRTVLVTCVLFFCPQPSLPHAQQTNSTKYSLSMPIINLDYGLICHRQDCNECRQACTRNLEDTLFFDFARTSYMDYLQNSPSYCPIPRIPKIIHQIWIDPHNPPSKFTEWQETWLALHTDWQ